MNEETIEDIRENVAEITIFSNNNDGDIPIFHLETTLNDNNNHHSEEVVLVKEVCKLVLY